MNSPFPAASIAIRITFALVIVVSALLLLNHAKSGSSQCAQDPRPKANNQEISTSAKKESSQ